MQSGNIIEGKVIEIWALLNEIPDPEIPVISVVELGVIRKVDLNKERLKLSITPTYSGCPAMDIIEQDILGRLRSSGYDNVEIEKVYAPAWTTDWMTEETLKKLENYGIAPPRKGTQDKGILFGSEPKNIGCPRCKSTNTEMVSNFGATACKAMYKCTDCSEPFEYFKCI